MFGNYGLKYAKFLTGEKDIKNNIDTTTPYTQMGLEMYGERQEQIAQTAADIDNKSVMSPEELEKKMIDMSVEYNKDECKYDNPLKE